MVPRYVAAVSVLAAVLCLGSAAQSSAPAPATSSQLPATSSSQQPAGSPSQKAAPTGGLVPGAPPPSLEDLPPDPHTPTPAEQAEEHQQRILAAITRLAGAQARWGPQISTPGIAISLVEINRVKIPDGTTRIDYQITSSGFTPGEKLSLIRWPLDTQARTFMNGLTVNASGVAVCAPPAPAEPSAPAKARAAPAAAPASPPMPGFGAPGCTDTMQPNQPLHIQTTAAPGEAIRVALIGADQKHGAATSAVPFPITSQDKGCKLEVLLGVRDASLVLVEGTGFPADKALKLDTITADNTRTISTKSNAQGQLVVALLSGAKGVDAGQTTVRYIGVSDAPSLQTPAAPAAPAASEPGCSPAVTFHWGKDSYKAD